MHCKDCQHWDREFHPGECNAPKWLDDREKPEDDKAGFYAKASDDTGLDAGFRTGPLFGCIKFVQFVSRKRR